MHILIPWRKCMQSFIIIGTKTQRSCAHRKYQLFIYKGWKLTKFTMWKKVTKNYLTIISKPHAYPHSMIKTYAKFQNDRYKTVRVALTRGNHCLYIEGEKWLSSQCGKSDKNVLTNIPKPHAHPHTMKKTHAKFQNNQYKTVRGVALTRHLG